MLDFLKYMHDMRIITLKNAPISFDLTFLITFLNRSRTDKNEGFPKLYNFQNHVLLFNMYFMSFIIPVNDRKLLLSKSLMPLNQARIK